MAKPIAIDLCCGLGGWTEGLLAEGYEVIGFDIEAHEYGEDRYPGQLVLQDILTLHGSQFKHAALIVASPPCQEYSYMAMPWRRAKQIAAALRGQGEFPEGYKGSRTIAELRALFDACFRIQQEACEAAGRHIPLVVENVKGAQPWLGRAAWNYGSYFLWGDLPALMPQTAGARKFNPDRIDHGTKNDGGSWFNIAHNTASGVANNPVSVPAEGLKNPGFRFDGSGRSFQTESVNQHIKQPGLAGPRKNGKGDAWFQDGAAAHGSKSSARKAASARIAKIPLPLSQWIARTYLPAARQAA